MADEPDRLRSRVAPVEADDPKGSMKPQSEMTAQCVSRFCARASRPAAEASDVRVP